jgi:hypothetical protein
MADRIFDFDTANYELLVLNFDEEPIRVTQYEMDVMKKFKQMGYEVYLGKAGDIPRLCRDEIDEDELAEILELDDDEFETSLLLIGVRRM